MPYLERRPQFTPMLQAHYLLMTSTSTESDHDANAQPQAVSIPIQSDNIVMPLLKNRLTAAIHQLVEE